jgi:hypothetical protein
MSDGPEPRPSVTSLERYQMVLALLPRDSELEMVNTSKLEAISREALRRGSEPFPGGAAVHATFLALSDHELDVLAKALLHGLAAYFNAIVEHAGPRGDTFERFLDAVLYMVAVGAAAFDDEDDFAVLLNATEGPPPSAAVERAIAAKIRSLRPRLDDLLDDVVEGN